MKKCVVMYMLPLMTLPMGACKEGKTEVKRMNVVYIMSDDHSYQTIGAYGQGLMETPNIDRIANEGALFANSFVANSISGPSRACMLTGKHSHMNGFTSNDRTFDGEQMTFPKLLQGAGYETAIVGKWHLSSEPTGFDFSDILIGQGIYYNGNFITNGKETPSQGYVTDVITDKALEWLENGRDKEKPFCLLLHHKAPHRTWMPDVKDLELYADKVFPLPENFYDSYEGRLAAQQQEMGIAKDMDLVYDLKLADKEEEIHSPNKWLEKWGRDAYDTMTPEEKAAWDAHYDPIIENFKKAKLAGKALAEWKYQQYMRDYCRVIHAVDRNVGRVMDYLEEKGLLENTMVVYTSDQGFYMGEHGWFDKRFMYEESFRTPLLVRYPGGKRGRIEQMVQNIDYGPTILDVAGVKVPEEMQGCSMLPLLKGENPKDWRSALYYHFYEYPAEHAVKRHYGVRTDRYKLMHFYNDIDAWEMYDLERDPKEMHNVYGMKEYEGVKKDMERRLVEMQRLYQDSTAMELNNFK